MLESLDEDSCRDGGGIRTPGEYVDVASADRSVPLVVLAQNGLALTHPEWSEGEYKDPSTRMRLAALVAPARDDGWEDASHSSHCPGSG